MRTANLSRSPYKDVVVSHPAVERFADAVLKNLGFEESKGTQGTLVQMQDDVYLKSGIKELISNVKYLVEKGGVIDAAVKERLEADEAERIANLPPDQSDDDDDDEINFSQIQEDQEQALASHRENEYTARENRLRESQRTNIVHERHNQSFVPRSEFDPKRVTTPPPVGDYSPRENINVGLVTGKPRPNAVPSLYSPSASGVPNSRYIEREQQAKQAVRTASTARKTASEPSATFADFAIHPAQVNFGNVQKDTTYRVTLVLTNCGYNMGKFQVAKPKQPAGSRNVTSVMYRAGEVASGMKRRIVVQFFAGDLGPFKNHITIRTEKAIFQLPMQAFVTNEPPQNKASVRRSLPQGTLPPIEGSQKFGATGAVRLFSRAATPKTQAYLDSLEGSAGVANIVQDGSRPTEPVVPEMQSSYTVDPKKSLEEMKEQDRI